MNKKTLDGFKKKLDEQKAKIEGELNKFAHEDKNLKGDWDTKYPQANGGSGSQALEDAADQVEEYMGLLSLEHNLEIRLKDVNSALLKMKKGKYGECEKCFKKIEEERLTVYPEARFCGKCHTKRRGK